MSCQNCDASKSFITIATDHSTYTISAFAMDGDAISFSSTEDDIDRKFDSLGNLLKAGSNIKRVTATLRVTCEGAAQLWTDFKNPTLDFCGAATLVDNCCTDESWPTAEVISVTRPSIGDSVNYFEIELLGVYQ